MNTRPKEMFENRAEYQKKAEENHCPNCNEPLVFGLKDKYHETIVPIVMNRLFLV